MRFPPIIPLLFISGCSVFDTQTARDPLGPVIGMSVVDFLECAGTPDVAKQIAPSVVVLEWNNKPSADKPLFSMSMPLGFSLQFGQPTTCHMIATITDTGTVVRIEFSGINEITGRQACSEMVNSCINHGDATSTVPVDPFKYLLNSDTPEKKP